MTTLNNMSLALSDYVLHIMSCTLLTYEETNNYKIVQYLSFYCKLHLRLVLQGLYTTTLILMIWHTCNARLNIYQSFKET